MASFIRPLAVGTAAVMLAVGCVSSPEQQVFIDESPKGAVYLEAAPQKDFQAAHPISLNPTVIARVLSGVRVRNEKTTIETLMAADPKAFHAFSDDEIAFLTPALTTALSRATPQQQIGFRVVRTTASEPEITAGTLYAHGLSLHLTLTEYRHKPTRPDAVNMPNRQLPDPTGLKRRDVLFVPQAARRPDTYKQGGFLSQPDLTTLVIDYDYLAKLSSDTEPTSSTLGIEKNARSDAPAPPTAQSEEESVKTNKKSASQLDDLQSVKDLVIKKDLELEAMKKELRLLRRQLAERESELEFLKRKRKPVPRPQETTP
jgi:hypothetical protein